MTGQHSILIMEDEKTLLNILSDKFKNEGFSVLKASDGKEGLDLALKNHPHIILMDVLMPEMDGMQVLENLRNDSWGKNAKVILLTNIADAGNIAKAVGEGAYEYLIKSNWQLEDIVEKVKKHLEK